MILTPFARGMRDSLRAVTTFCVMAFLVLRVIPYPTPRLPRSVSEIGIAILLAYVIEAVWMTEHLEEGTEAQREHWLGWTAGWGLWGLAGIAVSLLVAEHLSAGHANALDTLGLAWAVASLTVLGILVVVHPVIADHWGRRRNRERQEEEETAENAKP